MILPCGHPEPADGARVLTIHTGLSDRSMQPVTVRLCTDCALVVNVGLRAGDWHWSVETPATSAGTEA